MNMQFIPPISIEKFAAYLEGNLTSDEMRDVSSMIENDAELQELVAASNITAETMENYSPLEMELPLELQMDDFRVPQIDNSYFEMPFDDNYVNTNFSNGSLGIASADSDLLFGETIIDDELDLNVPDIPNTEDGSDTFESDMNIDIETE